MKRRLLGIIIVIVMLGVPFVIAQETSNIIEPTDNTIVNAAANITFPPPVYVVRDTIEVRGTVSLPTMRNFFVEFRPLIVDETDALPSDQRPWFPATLPQMQPVIDAVLGT